MRRFYQVLGSTGGLKYTPPLDIHAAGIWAAHSVRKVRTAYNGPCCRVVRFPDNAEFDIGFDSSGLISVSQLIFAAAGSDLRVKIVYDQSGHGRDLIAVTPCRIVDEGVVHKAHGFPSFNFNVVSYDYTVSHSGDLNNNSQKSVFVAFQTVASAGALKSLAVGTRGATAASGWILRHQSGIFFYGHAGSPPAVSVSLPLVANTPYLSSVTYENVSNGAKIYHNGVNVGVGTVSGGTDRSIYNYSRDDQGGGHVNYTFEHLIYSADKTAEISGIHSNINSYFSLY